MSKTRAESWACRP